MPDGKTKVSASVPKSLEKATRNDLIKWIADSIIGAKKK